MTRTFPLRLAGVLATVFVGFIVWLLAGWGGPATVRAVSNIGSVAAGMFAAACAARAAWLSTGRQRWAWSALSLGSACWVFGDTVWAVYELALGWETAPFPSIADVGYLLFPIASCIALILLPTGRTGQSELRLVIDGGIVATGLFIIFWAAGLDELFHDAGESLLAFAVSVAYPLGDLALLTVALLVYGRARVGQRSYVLVFAIAIVCMALSDAAFVFLTAEDDYVSGGLIDAGWVAGLLLLGWAALTGAHFRDVRPALAHSPSRAALWLPYAPVPVAAYFIATSPASIPKTVASLLLVTAVLARQFVIADENRRLLALTAEHAFRDPLTGLANRALLMDRLTHAVTVTHTHAQEIGVLAIDLDDFKMVNDSLGHPVGDELLCAVAVRIASCVRAGDTVARMGGDEFAVLVEDPTDSAAAVAHRIYNEFDAPFVVDDHEVLMRPSIGVASELIGGGVAGTAELLLKQADIAMYAAKRSQHGGVHIFTADMQMIDPAEVDVRRDRDPQARRNGSTELALFAQLRRAIDQGELSLVYQPKYLLSTGEVAGVEALVRWPHPQNGLMLPGEFLPLARRNGLMGAVTEAVLHRAVRDASQWRTVGVDMPFAVNLFPPTLADLSLCERIFGILDSRGLDAGCLTLEITEDVLLNNTKRTLTVLNELRESGIRVSLDDFGSGYSALSYLRDLPVDELKMDRHMVAPILDDERALAIVHEVIVLTHRLGMVCVAEGVEDAQTAAMLTTLDCDIVQGHFCSPPVSAEAVLDLHPCRFEIGALADGT